MNGKGNGCGWNARKQKGRSRAVQGETRGCKERYEDWWRRTAFCLLFLAVDCSWSDSMEEKYSTNGPVLHWDFEREGPTCHRIENGEEMNVRWREGKAERLGSPLAMAICFFLFFFFYITYVNIFIYILKIQKQSLFAENIIFRKNSTIKEK